MVIAEKRVFMHERMMIYIGNHRLNGDSEFIGYFFDKFGISDPIIGV